MSSDLSAFISKEAMDQFHADVVENLEKLEESLLQLEEDHSQTDLIHRVFRAVHSIKGAAHMFGFNDIATFAHDVEDLYGFVRKGEIPLTDALIGHTFQAHDVIAKLHKGSGDPAFTESVAQAFRRMTPGAAPSTPSTPASASAPVKKTPKQTWMVRFRFKQETPVFDFAVNPLIYLKGLCGMGLCKVTARPEMIPRLEQINPSVCYVYWEVTLLTDRSLADIKDEFTFIEEDLAELEILPQRRQADRRERPHEPAPAPTRRLRVLIAEDTFMDRLLLKRMLGERADADVVVNGEEAADAFEMALNDDEPYDLVLLDIMMPVMDGQKALKAIRRTEKERGVPPNKEAVVIMVSALNGPKEIMEAFHKGCCTDYLVKPVRREELLEKLVTFKLIEA